MRFMLCLSTVLLLGACTGAVKDPDAIATGYTYLQEDIKALPGATLGPDSDPLDPENKLHAKKKARKGTFYEPIVGGARE